MQEGDALALPFADGALDGAIDHGCFHTLPVRRRAEVAPEVRVRDVGQQVRPLAHSAAGQLRNAVLGDDDTRVVARRGDDRPRWWDPGNARHRLPVAYSRRAQADE